MTVITLGPDGTVSHELALKMDCRDIRLLPTIHNIMPEVTKVEGDEIVPIENSEAGGVGETMDGLMRYPLFITAEMYLPVHHHVASPVPMEHLTVIYAHPQTPEQCCGCLEEWNRQVIHTSSNTSSALEAKKIPNAGAVLSESATRLYRMPVIIRNVENNSNNTTRFIRVSERPTQHGGAAMRSIVIDPSTDRAGLLHDLLTVFANRSINLTRIESRPSKRGIGNYVFFLDYTYSPETSDALSELRAITVAKELGCYRCIGVPP